jgi:hypothetical protein
MRLKNKTLLDQNENGKELFKQRWYEEDNKYLEFHSKYRGGDPTPMVRQENKGKIDWKKLEKNPLPSPTIHISPKETAYRNKLVQTFNDRVRSSQNDPDILSISFWWDSSDGTDTVSNWLLEQQLAERLAHRLDFQYGQNPPSAKETADILYGRLIALCQKVNNNRRREGKQEHWTDMIENLIEQVNLLWKRQCEYNDSELQRRLEEERRSKEDLYAIGDVPKVIQGPPMTLQMKRMGLDQARLAETMKFDTQSRSQTASEVQPFLSKVRGTRRQ